MYELLSNGRVRSSSKRLWKRRPRSWSSSNPSSTRYLFSSTTARKRHFCRFFTVRNNNFTLFEYPLKVVSVNLRSSEHSEPLPWRWFSKINSLSKGKWWAIFFIAFVPGLRVPCLASSQSWRALQPVEIKKRRTSKFFSWNLVYTNKAGWTDKKIKIELGTTSYLIKSVNLIFGTILII